jgi:hypothetical protein
MTTYFKSLVTMEHSPITTTYDPATNSRRICQDLKEILDSKHIKPNTVHSQLEKRLCASAIVPGYTGTYRPEGILFETDAPPGYVIPFDLMALTDGKTFTSADYHDSFMEGSGRFKFSSIEEMVGRYPDSGSAVDALNAFRKENGLEAINPGTMTYNECCFLEDVRIRPVALIGQGRAYDELSKEHGIPLFSSMKQYQRKEESTLYDFTRKSVMGALFRVGSSFVIDSLGYLALTGAELNSFADRFQWDKFLSVTAAVVAINFVDYRYDITNKLDRLAGSIIGSVRGLYSSQNHRDQD